MRTAVSAAAVAALALALVLVPSPTSASAAGVSTATSTITVRCSLLQSREVDVDWYAPSTRPTALVYLQHDWFDTGRQMRDAALAFASAGYLVAVPSLPSLSWSCGLGDPGMARALAPMLAGDALLAAGRDALGAAWPSDPDRLVLVGHGVGAAAVSALAAQPRLRSSVALVVHLDGRDTRAGLLHAALQADRTTPVLQLTAGEPEPGSDPGAAAEVPGSVPSSGVVDTFRPGGSFRPGTDGAVVLTGRHCDPRGQFPLDPCGSSAQNQRAFFALAVAGAGEVLGVRGPSFDDALAELAAVAVQTPRPIAS
jgi:hypothetical protein